MSRFDAHCHLTARAFDEDRAHVLGSAHDAGVRGIHVPGYDAGSWERRVTLTGASGVRLGVGLHPWWVHDAADDAIDVALAWLHGVVHEGLACSVGETGLDRTGGRAASIDRQVRVFVHQLALARGADLPVALHVVGAHGLALSLLGAQAPRARARARGYVHGFTAAPEVAARYVALGLSISFGASVTDVSARRARASAVVVPDTHLLVETDAPDGRFVRGERASPVDLGRVLEALADIRGTTVAHVAAVTSHNAARLFGAG